MPVLPDLEALLLYGSLPGIFLENNADAKQIDLEAYVTNYLDEEVRGEALARQLGSFARFIELAAVESGNQINVSKLSQELSIARHTIDEYLNILEDCLITEKIEPVTQVKTRRRLSKASKYIFFDMGIRRIAAREGIRLSQKTMSELFEQFVGLELLRNLRVRTSRTKLRYWRDHAGPEIDYIVEKDKKYLPVEVKWSEHPTEKDTKHIIKFMEEYDCMQVGYVICRCKKPFILQKNIMALPWQELGRVVEAL